MPRNLDRSALDPNQIAVHGFGTGFRGYDQDEVRAYLKRLAALVQDVMDEQTDLTGRLAEAEERAARPPELTEDQLTVALGEETARVLSSARQAAAAIRTKAEGNAARVVDEAIAQAAAVRAGAEQYATGLRSEVDDQQRQTREESERVRSEADLAAIAVREEADTYARERRAEIDGALVADRLAAVEQVALLVAEAEADVAARRTEADSEIGRLRAEAEQVLAVRTAEAAEEVERIRADAADIRGDAQRDAEAVREAAREEGRQMVTEAQLVRERMLKDLARRRKGARQQLEQLAAARERLLEAYGVVRQTVEDATSELLVALPEAKDAAAQAGRRAGDEAEATVDELEAEIDAARPSFPETDAVPEPEPEPEPVPEPEELIIDLDAPAPAADAAEEAEVAVPSGSSIEAPVSVEGEAQQAPIVERAPGASAAPELAGAPEPDVSSLFARIRADQVVPTTLVERPDRDLSVVAPGPVAVLSRLEERDGVTEEIEHRLARKLKRVLADEQSTVLDAVRRTRGLPVPDEVLPDTDAHELAYAEAASDDLAAAAAAGAFFEDASSVVRSKVDDLAAQLAEELTGQLRNRLQRSFDDISGDEDELTNRIRSCYREWRSQRIVEGTRHFVLAAFARGQYDATPAGSRLQWVVDHSGQACPDAEDNALAGAVPKGDVFPTGHCLPPAHPGCRCLVVRVGDRATP